MESLGVRLKQIRKQKGFTQVELGKLVGVSGVSVGYWEKDINVPGSMVLSKLAKVLGTTDSYLLHGIQQTYDVKNVRIGNEIPLLSWDESISFLNNIEGDTVMVNHQETITTFIEVKEGDFAVKMPDDTMLNPSGGGASIPVGSTVILRPGEHYENGSIVAVIVPDPLYKKPSLTIKKLVVDGQNIYLTPLNPRYSSSPLTLDCKIVAVAKGVQYSL
ncbi:helix-turn-helix domain-containing protein [Salmonella enterica]|nr:helix-turn-helix domain-containing protein [Salmonella enterica]